jgi:hypothetical protein
MRLVAILGVLLLVCAVRPVWADESERKTLSGLSGIRALVERVNEPLDRSALQVELEQQLRNAGIRLLDKDAALKAPGCPYLHVFVNTCSGEYGFVAVRYDVELYQNVILARDPGINMPATTWYTGRVDIVVDARLVKTVRNTLKKLVGEFINDYKAANFKTRPAQGPSGNQTQKRPKNDAAKTAR